MMGLRSISALFCCCVAALGLRIRTGGSQPLTVLAGKELRRYLYVGGLLAGDSLDVSKPDELTTVTITTVDSDLQCDAAEVLSALRSQAEGYSISQIGAETCITGSGDAGALQGVYSLLELLGFLFSSTNPVIPKNLKPWPSDGYHSLATPAFSTRGLQPFHGTA